MPLRIKLPSHDRIIINGAVLENSGDSTTLIVHNRVDILRRKEVMAEQEATTPARRVYYSLQCAYMFDEERSRYITHALEFLKQYRDAAPSAATVIAKIAEELEEQRFYGALKATNDLVNHESERLKIATGNPQGIAATPLELKEAENASLTEAASSAAGAGKKTGRAAANAGNEPIIKVKKDRKPKKP